MPRVVVVVDGDELRRTRRDARVRHRRDPHRLGLGEQSGAVTEVAFVEQLPHGCRIGPVDDHEQMPVGELLAEDVVECPGEEQRTILGADDDVDGGHAVSLWAGT